LGTGEFTGSQKAAFPFILAAKDDQMIYSPDCVPEGFSLSDPDHLQASNIISLYNHWLGRQKKGLAPFIILSSSPLHGPTLKKSDKGKGKKKTTPYVEVTDTSSSDGSDDEEDDRDVEKDVVDPAPKVAGKNSKVPDSTTPPSQAAGPSSQALPRRGGKSKPSKVGMELVKKTGVDKTVTRNPESKKRQAEDDLVNHSPAKIPKTGHVRKSGRVAAKAKVDETKVSLAICDLDEESHVCQNRRGQKRHAEDQEGLNEKKSSLEMRKSHPSTSGDSAMYVSSPQTSFRLQNLQSALSLPNGKSELGLRNFLLATMQQAHLALLS
jgi:hypothetical protein